MSMFRVATAFAIESWPNIDLETALADRACPQLSLLTHEASGWSMHQDHWVHEIGETQVLYWMRRFRRIPKSWIQARVLEEITRHGGEVSALEKRQMRQRAIEHWSVSAPIEDQVVPVVRHQNRLYVAAMGPLVDAVLQTVYDLAPGVRLQPVWSPEAMGLALKTSWARMRWPSDAEPQARAVLVNRRQQQKIICTGVLDAEAVQRAMNDGYDLVGIRLRTSQGLVSDIHPEGRSLSVIPAKADDVSAHDVLYEFYEWRAWLGIIEAWVHESQ